MRRAFDVLSEIIKKYGTQTKVSPRKSYYTIGTDADVSGWAKDTTWWIRGFTLNTNKTISVNVYWQGDSTDGDEILVFKSSTTDVLNLPPTEPVRFGNQWYVARDGICIEPSDIYEAIKGIKI